MRPIRLAVKGFTSFRDEQAIDFEGLDLFAIVGPTGSGKSSLLDAITYALFGEVDRVGRGVSQLVSQGQPRMAVTFDFEVAGERYRVTRSTSASKTAPTKILLQVHDGDDWRQAGEGSDRVRDVNARLRAVIGLDFDAFTRSVLLPQGRFAEFLVGEAKDRREILTELLGLELFKRLAKRAGEVRSGAAIAAQAKADLLDTEYAGVSRKALDEAARTAKAAAARERALAKAVKAVRALARKGERADAEVRELRGCALEAADIARAAADAHAAFVELAAELAEAKEAVEATVEGAEELAKEAAQASDARARAEAEWGPAMGLVAMRARAEELAGRRREIAELGEQLVEATAAIPRRDRSAASAGRDVSKAEAERGRGLERLAAAREALEGAQHANLVDAVRAGAVVGDPCPVCGVPIAAAPEGGGSADIAAAKRSVQAAEDALAALDDAVRGAERRRDAAESERADARRDVERLEGEMERRRSDVAEMEDGLAGVGAGEKEDPLAVIDERLDRLERLSSVERAAGEAAAAAERLGVEARTRLVALAGRVAELRAGLAAQPVAALLARAARLSPEDLDAAAPSGLGALPEDAAGLTEASANMSEVLHRVAGELERIAARRAEGGARLLAEAHAAVEGLLEPPAGALDELVDTAEAAARSATAESATAAEQSARLRERLEASAKLAEEVRVLRERAERFAALARELRADNVIEFLQLEALELLAAAGSERLTTLSDGRYRLQFDADEFFVVDTWNGEEVRSARTLSGGETFLASLALALALSDQVQSLAVSERARLESLFLDEGFGTLDPETLEVVVGAIEGLGGDERMVGVITHVQELAIRLPARVEVEKSPRGSSLRIVS